MQVVVMGATDLTISVLEAVLASEVTLAGVVTAPREVTISYAPNGVVNSRHADIPGWCMSREIPCSNTTQSDEIEAFVKQLGADFCLVAGWLHMVPQRVRELFGKGCAGFHASLLPELRGGAPLPWAILGGFDRTGVTMFELGDGVDEGPVYGQQEIRIEPRTMVAELVDASLTAAYHLTVSLLPRIADETVTAAPQVGRPSYGLQRSPADGLLDWAARRSAVDRVIRACGRPYPGAFTWITVTSRNLPITAKIEAQLAKVHLWKAEPSNIVVYGSPGQIASIGQEVHVMCGDGPLCVHEATIDDVDALPLLRKMNHRRFGHSSTPASAQG